MCSSDLPRPGDSGLTLTDDRLSFVAAGAGPPFDPGYNWQFTIGPDSGGVALAARPVGRAPATQVSFRLPGVTRWEVRVLAPGGSDWMGAWTSGLETPRAIAITLWNGSEPLGPPLRLALSQIKTPTRVEMLDGE